MSGTWIYKAPQRHECDPPEVYGATVGSIYACDCGSWWVLREGSSWLCWREMSPRQIRHHKKLGGTV